MEKINIAELLKDCPSGIELDCPMYEKLYFDRVEVDTIFPIVTYTLSNMGIRTAVVFTESGRFNRHNGAKCVIFPKGKTTWEGFVPPHQFKDGDVVYIKTKGVNHNEFIVIFKEIKNDHIHKHACFAYQVLYTNKNAVCHLVDVGIMRLATEEEKQKLFEAIKSNDYKWNAETKTLEKLVEPKFKVGDRIVHKQEGNPFTITEITDGCYKGGTRYAILITQQDNFELTHNKFDITTLKPFDKVLVRDNDKQEWGISFFSHCNGLEFYKYSCINRSGYAYCIPYENNEHLLGTTNDCDDFYKTWEK